MKHAYTSTKNSYLKEQAVDSLYWYNHNDISKASVRQIYNPVKRRIEIWWREVETNSQWQLSDVFPGLKWRETFMGPIHAFVGLVGLSMDKTWSTNGNPAPAAGNFVSANQLSGGMILRCLGASDNDWVAIHTGEQYPTVYYASPHFHFHSFAPDFTNMYILAGLVGSSNLETGNAAAWTTPDDGIWLEYDSDVNNQSRFVTSNSGVQQSSILGTPSAGVENNAYFYVEDAGDAVVLNINGLRRARHTLHIPTAKLKPIFMIGSRDTVVRNRYLLDMYMIWDHTS